MKKKACAVAGCTVELPSEDDILCEDHFRAAVNRIQGFITKRLARNHGRFFNSRGSALT
jgi:hypothetical protein